MSNQAAANMIPPAGWKSSDTAVWPFIIHILVFTEGQMKQVGSYIFPYNRMKYLRSNTSKREQKESKDYQRALLEKQCIEDAVCNLPNFIQRGKYIEGSV